ncbi:MAG: M23 family metallopeptidase [Sphingobium sp.]
MTASPLTERHLAERHLNWRTRIEYWAEDVNLVPDLGNNIGSLQWFRGAATCFALCVTALSLKPDFAPLPAASEPVMTAASYDEIRSQMVTPLALGADSGRHMGPTDAVAPLNETPERPTITLNAAIGAGDSMTHALARAGVSSADAARVMDLVAIDLSPGASLPAGTRLDITLGRRASRNMPRPLERLSFRASLDMAIDISRENGALSVRRTRIAVDNTPLRIRGVVTDSLYQAARAAGALPATIQNYLRVIGQHVPLSSIAPGTKFDIIVSHRRAETGETETGELLYGGLQLASGKKVDMLRWAHDGKNQWFEASGVGQVRPGLARPVARARLSSGFGMRFHPILGYSRLHAGVDYAAPTGTPIYAVADGRVAFAGRHGGHGNYVKLAHNGGMGTGYAHMSRVAVRSGEAVRRGQVIGYVGSTGLSTGPHLHYEVYRGGKTVNPLSVKFEQGSQLAGRELQAFRSRLTQLKAITNSPATHSPASTASDDSALDEPTRIAMR